MRLAGKVAGRSGYGSEGGGKISTRKGGDIVSPIGEDSDFILETTAAMSAIV
ncbi:MAG: hypothetical protein COB08_000270 [Rhodobacteraceae bacterium]|nr:hypothetical protein [Paracoccaceae bacterium]